MLISLLYMFLFSREKYQTSIDFGFCKLLSSSDIVSRNAGAIYTYWLQFFVNFPQWNPVCVCNVLTWGTLFSLHFIKFTKKMLLMLKLHTNYGFYELFLKLNEHATLFIPREKRKEKNFLSDKIESTPLPFQWGSCDSFFSFPCSILSVIVCPFSFSHCIVRTSIYGFQLPLWYFQICLLPYKKTLYTYYYNGRHT